MILQDLAAPELSKLLSTSGISLDSGSFRTHLRTDVEELVEEIARHYAGFPIETEPAINDFFVRISPRSAFRRVFRRNVSAFVEEGDPFEPMSRDLAFPLFESALNWCIAKRTARYLLIHAAVVARDGRALILPAPSGSGKSTLCAYLHLAGWRLLSDELAIIRIEDGRILGNPRPISLKNESIARIGEAGGAADLSRSFEGTTKGTIAFLRPNAASLAEIHEPCIPALVVFPSFRRGAPFKLQRMDRGQGFKRLIENAVNYLVLGRGAYETLTGIVEGCGVHRLEYEDQDQAIAALEELLAASGAEAREAASA